jgi:hypothetical protein
MQERNVGPLGSTRGHPPLAPGLRLAQMLTLKDQTDAVGRLILEDSAPKRAIKNAKRSGVEMKTAPSAYADTPSRLGGLMNVSAYEALRHDMADVLNGFAWLSSHYLSGTPEPTRPPGGQQDGASRRSTVRTLFDVAYMGVTLPLLLFHRRPDPIAPYGALPTFIASVCKASRGVVSASVDLLNQAGDPMEEVTAAAVVLFADRQGHLRRPNTDRACAAPTRLIERTIAVILTGEGGDPAKSTLPDFVDYPTLRAFCDVQDAFSQALSQYKHLLDTLTAGTAAADPNQLFSTPVEFGGRTRSFGALSEALLGHAHATQGRLNRILGRDDNPARVSFEELLRML